MPENASPSFEDRGIVSDAVELNRGLARPPDHATGQRPGQPRPVSLGIATNKEERLKYYLAQAKEAAEDAERATTREAKAQLEKIAQTYRNLATFHRNWA